MGLRGALAGLLLPGPAHGYELQVRLAGELGPLWVAKASQVYLTLGRMQRDGLVTATRVRQTSRPDRQLLALTAWGRRSALDWLEQPGPREELVVRLAVARVAAPDRFAELAELVLAERSAALRELREVRGRVGGGFQREAVEAEIQRTQAEVRWLAGVRDRADTIVAAPMGRRGEERVAKLA
jgi:DNA-binding PadR family transcriptional regulator